MFLLNKLHYSRNLRNYGDNRLLPREAPLHNSIYGNTHKKPLGSATRQVQNPLCPSAQLSSRPFQRQLQDNFTLYVYFFSPPSTQQNPCYCNYTEIKSIPNNNITPLRISPLETTAFALICLKEHYEDEKKCATVCIK